MKDQSLKASHTLIILVNIEATPTSTVRWFHGDKELHHGGNVTIETEETFSRLTIKGITGKQSGAYRIVAENKVGKAEEEFSVTIKGNQSKVIFLRLSFSFHDLHVQPRNYSHIRSHYGFCDFKDTHNWTQCIVWHTSTELIICSIDGPGYKILSLFQTDQILQEILEPQRSTRTTSSFPGMNQKQTEDVPSLSTRWRNVMLKNRHSSLQVNI